MLARTGQTWRWQNKDATRRDTPDKALNDALQQQPASTQKQTERGRESEREREREIVSGLGLLRNCILCFISLSSGSRHCLLLYGLARKELGNRKEEAQGAGTETRQLCG